MNIIGIDVSKNKLDCVLYSSSRPDKPLHKVVTNASQGFEKLINWCCKKAQCQVTELHFIMEATGPYHEAAAEAFFNANANVSVVNPARIKNYAKGIGLKAKNDKQDAMAIARFGLDIKPALWQPEAPEYRHLKQLQNRLEAVEQALQRENNRLEKALVGHATTIVIESLQRSINFLQAERQRLLEQIDEHIQSYPELSGDKQLLESIPGVGSVISILMLVLLQHGQRFTKASQVAAYLGLIPTEHRSGSSVSKKPTLSKQGNSLYRAKLYMAAVVAIKYNPDVKDLYERLLARGKCKMSALGAAMRKLVHICFGVIKNQTAYQPQIT